MKDLLLLVHPIFGVFGIVAAIWLIVELLNIREGNLKRIRIASVLVAVFMVLTWIAGGYWYVNFYAPDKALILAGPWPIMHTFFMEAKDPLCFITLLLPLYLPFAVRYENLIYNRGARILVFTVAVLIILSGLFLEAAGSLVSLGVKMGLTSPPIP